MACPSQSFRLTPGARRTAFGPAAELLPNFPFAAFTRQIALGCPGAGDPEDRIQHPAVRPTSEQAGSATNARKDPHSSSLTKPRTAADIPPEDHLRNTSRRAGGIISTERRPMDRPPAFLLFTIPFRIAKEDVTCAFRLGCCPNRSPCARRAPNPCVALHRPTHRASVAPCRRA